MKRKTVNLNLVTLIANNALASATLPTDLKLLNWGSNVTRKGIVNVGEKTLTLLPLTQHETGFDRIALDYEHNTVKGTPAYVESKEPRDVAAYGVPQVRRDGLWITDLQWTPSGLAKAKNFADLSPAITQDESGEVTFMHSVALCRQGAVDGLSFYSVDLSSEVPAFTKITNDEETQLMDKIMALLRKGLGLAETADENEIAKALGGMQTFSTEIAGIKTKLTTLSADIMKEIEQKATKATKEDGKREDPELVALTAKLGTIETQLKTFSSEIEKRDREEICAQARREGKVVPLSVEQIATTPVVTLREMVEKLTATVPVDQRTPNDVKTLSIDGSGHLTELDKKSMAACGYTEEQVKKANNLK